MVFSGRPSRACHACRVKRLKCDRVKPGCTQCARKRIECPGYRHTNELRIRDETESVARKVLKPARAKGDLFQGSQPDIPYPDVSIATRQHLHFGSLSILNTATDNNAICYFMSSYIVSCPFQEYLPGLYARCNLDEDALSSSVRAASFATFAQRSGHPGYMAEGGRSYVLALSRTNAALANPTTALLDQTLASILLLGVFESTVFPGAKSPKEWTTHLLGASKLLQLRRLKQFKSDAGPQLFTHTANNIRASCIQREVDLPADFQAVYDKARPFLDPKDPGNRIGLILEEAVRIRARLSNLTDDTLYDLFYEAAIIERKAAAFMKDDNPELAYTIRSKENTPSWAYLNIAYHYKSHRASKHCNTVRMIRLFLLEVMSAGASLAAKEMQNQTDTKSSTERVRDLSYIAAFKEDAFELYWRKIFPFL
ncbi:hypothetical protein VE04_07129 [Pseudogymnoascus sp. 24MN13]|nr:hypothetical protein VE04_07129 [Pseudogymnoascus sp. 24MN13]